jgi:hypothetical protein
MGYAYSNSGLTFRAWDDPNNLKAGEVYFDHLATSDELAVQFSGYADAAAVANAPKQFAALIAAGLAITSTGTPSINGTYACDTDQQDMIVRLQTYIEKNNAFPGGLSAVQLRLAAGGAISLPSIAVFQAVATAIGDFIAKADEAELAALAGATWAAPSSSVTIA